MDVSRHRRSSSFGKFKNEKPSNFIRDTILDQAIREFDVYQEYAPNTYDLYVNDSTEIILGTMQDVSDLELLTDTKWLLAPLSANIKNGDIITEKISNKKWICIYDKNKTTQDCLKVKIQPCTYAIRIPYLNNENVPMVHTADAVAITYITDIKDFKQPFPTENGTTFMSVQYNPITANIKRLDRLWYFDSYEVIGIDYSNVNNYKNCGTIKWTLRPTIRRDDYDNYELGICDYYKYFKKNIATPINNDILTYEISNKTPLALDKVNIKVTNYDNVKFVFYGETLGCTLTNVTSNSCVLNTSKEIGIVYVKCYLEDNPNIYTNIRIVIKS
jgi:hypothetical protein